MSTAVREVCAGCHTPFSSVGMRQMWSGQWFHPLCVPDAGITALRAEIARLRAENANLDERMRNWMRIADERAVQVGTLKVGNPPRPGAAMGERAIVEEIAGLICCICDVPPTEPFTQKYRCPTVADCGLCMRTAREIIRRFEADWQIGRELERKDAEIARLRAAKTAALKIADERSREIIALRAEVERLRAALRPFVDFLSAYPRPRIHVSPDDTIIVSSRDVHLTLGHLDRARDALDPEQEVKDTK